MPSDTRILAAVYRDQYRKYANDATALIEEISKLEQPERHLVHARAQLATLKDKIDALVTQAKRDGVTLEAN